MPTPPERLDGGDDTGLASVRDGPAVEPDDAWGRPDEASAGFDPPAVPDEAAAPADAAAAGFDAAEDDDVAAAEGFTSFAALAPAGAAAEPALDLVGAEDAAADFAGAPAAIFTGLPAALAMPAFDGLSAAEVAPAAPLAVAGAIRTEDGEAETDSLAPLFAGAPLLTGVAGWAVAAGWAGVAGWALVDGSPAGGTASPGVAVAAAVVLSPSLTVAFFSALRSIVWLRGLVGLDRRGRLVIASAPCSRVAAAGRDRPRRSISGSLVLHSRAWRKRPVHIRS